MDYSAPNLAQLINEISEYEQHSHAIQNGVLKMDIITDTMRRMSSIDKYTPVEKQEMSRLDVIHRSTPMVRHIVKDAKDPAALFLIAQSILTRSPSEFKMLVINNNTYLEKAIRRIFKEKIDACTDSWNGEIRGFFRSNSRAQDAVLKRDMEIGKLHNEMQQHLSELTKLNKCLFDKDFSFLKHISDFKQHLIDTANKDLEENPWLKIVSPEILAAIHHGFDFDRSVKKRVWEEPVVISAMRGRLHDSKDKTEFLRRFVVYPYSYSKRYSLLVDTFTGEFPALSFDDMPEETASHPETDVVAIGREDDFDFNDDSNSSRKPSWTSRCSKCGGTIFIPDVGEYRLNRCAKCGFHKIPELL